MNQKNMIFISAIISLAMGFGGAAMAQEDDKKKDKMLMDPMTRAELQCAKLKADAALGSDEEKKAAEKKCEQAIEWAKEMIKKEAEKKPDPDSDPNA